MGSVDVREVGRRSGIPAGFIYAGLFAQSYGETRGLTFSQRIQYVAEKAGTSVATVRKQLRGTMADRLYSQHAQWEKIFKWAERQLSE
jgi:hypothetical protein